MKSDLLSFIAPIDECELKENKHLKIEEITDFNIIGKDINDLLMDGSLTIIR